MPELVPCLKCNRNCNPLVNLGCRHGYCENCWEEWAEHEAPMFQVQARLRVKCLHPECTEAVPTDLWRKILAPSNAVRACADMADAADAEMKRLQTFATVTRLASQPVDCGPVCPV